MANPNLAAVPLPDPHCRAWQKAFPVASDEMCRILNAHKRDMGAGSILEIETAENSATYCVLSGWLALSKSMADGARQIVDVALPGGIIDPLSADGSTSPVQIETLTEAKIAVVPRAVWAKLEDSEPGIRELESMTLGAALSRMSERMLRLGKGSAETRIAFALIELCMRLSATGDCRENVYHLPLTQQVLGDFVGLSSVHVCRTMRRLTRSGVIATENHMDIRIRDVGKLAEMAGVDLEILRRQIIPRR